MSGPHSPGGAPTNHVPATIAPPEASKDFPETREETREKWLNSVYLTYPYSGRSISITVKDFIAILATTRTYPGHSWVNDDQIDLALTLVADNTGRIDILILSPQAGQGLASLGLRSNTLNDFAQTNIDAYQQMSSEGIRWIVVPCTDALPVEPTAEEVAETAKNQSATKQHPSTISSHWGFMVIDKTESQAWWLDGHLTLRRRGNKSYIQHMYRAGWTAGKALRGFEIIMGRVSGQFTASTIKHVPHDEHNNGYEDDAASGCGPWVVAMFQYILNHPEFLENAHGLKGAFAASSREEHNVDLAFNSLRTREHMQAIISAELEREDPTVFPYRLDLEKMRILGIPHSVHGLMQLVLESERDRETNRGDRQGGKDGGRGDNDDDDDDDDDFFHEGKPYHKWLLREEINANPGLYTHVFSRNQRYNLVCQFLVERQANDDAAAAAAAAQNPYSKNWATRVYPKGFNKDNLPDFSTLTQAEGQYWEGPYRDSLFSQDPEQRGPFESYLPILHRTYKGDFSTEPLEALQRYFRNDMVSEVAFDKSERGLPWTAQRLATRLNETYLTLEVPLFATLTDAQIDAWVARLPPAALAIFTHFDQDDITQGVVWYRYGRGLLHRMFVGELDDMSADDIRQWREADSCIDPANTIDNETAMVKMKILYEGPGFEKVPYLRESPLHWPHRRYRPSPREKRKRSDDDDIDGEDKDDTNSGKRPQTKSNESGKAAEFVEVPDSNDVFATVYSEGSKPTQGPKTTQDPKTIDWSMISDLDLGPYITDEVRHDPRIGNTFNRYSYRAILFLKHGGTFKNNSQEERTTIWARDTNVFTHGDESGPIVDLTLLSTGRFDVRPVPEEILGRMADRYESESAAPIGGPEARVVDELGAPEAADKDRTTKAPSASNAQKEDSAPKAQRENSATNAQKGNSAMNTQKGNNATNTQKENSATTKPAIEKGNASNGHSVNFLHQPDKELDHWLLDLPAAATRLIKPTTGIWLKRTLLQKLFGGFRVLSEEDLEYWEVYDTRFRERRKQKGWNSAKLVATLEHYLKDTPEMDCRGPLESYPKSYVERWKTWGGKEDWKKSREAKGKRTGKQQIKKDGKGKKKDGQEAEEE